MKVMDKVLKHKNTEAAYQDSDGVWVELKDGLQCVYSGAHCVHEDTWTQALFCVRCAIPCNCGECN